MCWHAPRFTWNGTEHEMTIWLSPCKKMREEYPNAWENIPVGAASAKMLLCAISYVAPINDRMLDYLYAELAKRTEES